MPDQEGAKEWNEEAAEIVGVNPLIQNQSWESPPVKTSQNHNEEQRNYPAATPGLFSPDQFCSLPRSSVEICWSLLVSMKPDPIQLAVRTATQTGVIVALPAHYLFAQGTNTVQHFLPACRDFPTLL